MVKVRVYCAEEPACRCLSWCMSQGASLLSGNVPYVVASSVITRYRTIKRVITESVRICEVSSK